MALPPDPATPPLPRRSAVRFLRNTAIGLVFVGGIFAAGPRNTFGPDAPAPREAPPTAIAALDEWIARQEAAVPDIRPGLAKGVVWHADTRRRTPWSVVYLHGFSASRLETAPLAEQVAQALGANLFQTRLTGHGRVSPQAMGEASAQDWLADTTQALDIGQLLGDKVLVISCSTGSTLATWLALRPEGRAIAAHVFISPNFGPRDKRSEFINGPWGRQIALALQGEMRGRIRDDPREAHAWTSPHPTRALFPMMALVQQVRDADMAPFQAPLLVLYSEQDRTVDPQHIRAAFERITSSPKKAIIVDYSESAGQHVLAGDIRAPRATAPMAASIVDWVRSLP